MGASADEIDREIRETRAHLDENIGVLEHRAASSARRVGSMAAIGLVAGLAIAGVAYLVYRRVRKPSLTDRVHDLLPDAITNLPDDLLDLLRNRRLKVVVSTNEEDARPGAWASIGGKVAPALASAIATAALAKVLGKKSSAKTSQE